MKITLIPALCFSCIMMCSCAIAKANTTMDTLTNKQRVLSFYKLIVGQRKAEPIPDFLLEDYKQHNPMVKQGRAGITEMINYLKTLPPPPETAKSPIIRSIQEGDLVVTHLDIQFMGKRMAVIDLFKLKDGMLAEHWDVIEEIPYQTGEDITATNGVADIDHNASAANSKRVVHKFYNAIINKDPSASNWIKPDYTEHDPQAIKSSKGLIAYLNNDPLRHIKIHGMVAEGNFVMVQSQFENAGKAFVLYEIFRIEGDKIAERWSAKMVVPDGIEAERLF